MDPYRLIKDEIVYELTIRKQSTEGTVAELRKRLYSVLAVRTSIDKDVLKGLVVEDELQTCSEKFKYLTDAFDECAGMTLTVTDVKRLESRILHVANRVKRLGDEGNVLYVQLESLYGKLKSAAKTTPVPPDPKPTNPEPAASTPGTRLNKPDPKIYKWGLTFSGDTTGVSLGDFLDEVEDKRVSRKVSKAELFESAVDLFSGTARIWYRANHEKLQSWEDLNLRREHLPFLCNVDYATVDELETALCRLELWTRRADAYREPPSRNLLEPRLGYQPMKKIVPKVSNVELAAAETPAPNPRPVTRTNRFKNTICWNCDQAGHTFRLCCQLKWFPQVFSMKAVAVLVVIAGTLGISSVVAQRWAPSGPAQGLGGRWSQGAPQQEQGGGWSPQGPSEPEQAPKKFANVEISPSLEKMVYKGLRLVNYDPSGIQLQKAKAGRNFYRVCYVNPAYQYQRCYFQFSYCNSCSYPIRPFVPACSSPCPQGACRVDHLLNQISSKDFRHQKFWTSTTFNETTDFRDNNQNFVHELNYG
ncbi:hypothetical protein GE061_012464 [Apolygus lucorum]|uniref:CCHC-type domain-containing protein n=1 Tax=Apolygus lucorum TaxID=248454 RepID=A0A8S9XSN5_APOLU|nr:hypothetical protein GE061_012464 [Apolygus lucorum]